VDQDQDQALDPTPQALRHHEITAEPSQDIMLPKGSKRARRQKRHYSGFVKFDDDNPFNSYHSTFSAAITELTRIYIPPKEPPIHPQSLNLHRDNLPPKLKH